MNGNLADVYKRINVKTKAYFLDNAFNAFLDNEISAEEFADLIRMHGFSVPDKFLLCSVPEQRPFYNHTDTVIDYDNGHWVINEYEKFNAEYFYAFAEDARKSLKLTTLLIKYIKKLCVDKDGYLNNYNLLPLLFSKVYVQSTVFSRAKYEENVGRYSYNHSATMADLVIGIMNEISDINDDYISKCQENLISAFKSPELLELDMEKINEPVIFMFLIESVLFQLEVKDANTLKVCFGILNESDLREIDYYSNPKDRDRIKKAFRKKISDEVTDVRRPTSHDANQKIALRTVNAVKNFVKDNPVILKLDNGYTVLYHNVLYKVKK